MVLETIPLVTDWDDCYVWSATPMPNGGGRHGVPRRAVFLDRDGTINVGPGTGRYIRDVEQLALLPGAARAIRSINDSDALAVVVSNQRWLSLSGGSPAAFRVLDEYLRQLLAKEGAYLDALSLIHI